MGNKILLWGVIIFMVGGIGWFVAVIPSVITFGELRNIANLFGIAAGLGMLMIVLGAIFKLLKKNKKQR
ncbi:MAG: hypothetical protein A2831_01295 [Candidatus Yanofskybacteria bacterium RIFCSPHIGHO2_01_FULL_44_17]|uniref:Uncharacterized protein n=1 Tax=Candidatus Yanofskybacteria bacterium RIFCSPHIGHO2_01_FULL_44_17 TaxID=1802668 RepID=A0A1F8EUZ2_9BACT|nr:MAG: hypothetical protein A2831_01295 [Candidatus Yanofskybacteria bacterium RIFCSPHIGHO2_01_FULL_44_17]